MEYVGVVALAVWVCVGHILLKVPLDMVLFAYAVAGIFVGILHSYVGAAQLKQLPSRNSGPWTSEQKRIKAQYEQWDGILYIVFQVFMFSGLLGMLIWKVFRLKYLFGLHKKED